MARYTLLRHVTVPEAWLRWSETHGVEGLIDPLAGPQFDQFQTMIRAVMAGMGLALVPRCLVQDEITAGLVREPLPGADLRGGYRSDVGYWFCYPEGRTQLHALQRFKEWLLACAEPVGLRHPCRRPRRLPARSPPRWPRHGPPRRETLPRPAPLHPGTLAATPGRWA